MAEIVSASGGGVLIRVKAVPGAKRDEISGVLGDRLKVRVSAAPEGGKANAAICAVIAGALGVRARDVSVVQGASGAEKVVEARGVSAEAARRALAG
ncbi:MAG: DUF167 domain-containing protein [Phycisphaerales bacterium]